jgi:hypothetical protein
MSSLVHQGVQAKHDTKAVHGIDDEIDGDASAADEDTDDNANAECGPDGGTRAMRGMAGKCRDTTSEGRHRERG